MKYFVSIEKTPYFYWQTELLIESFKKLELEKDLVIAIADSKEGGKFVPKNISECDVFLHKNWIEDFNFKYINKYLSLDLVRRTRKIKPPFVVIEPDMVLLKKIEFKNNDCDVIVSESPSNNFENFEKFNINLEKKNWTNTGSILAIFKDAPVMYNEIANKCNEIINNNKDLVKDNWRILDKIAANIIFQKYHLKVGSRNDLECSLHEDKESFFLHYNMPYDFFSKFNFNSKEEGVLDLNAYNKILTINPKISNNIEKIQENVKSLIKKIKV